MRWNHAVAYFFGGAFLANTVPHLGNGISGNAFQSPFASPPGVGLSSSMVNVLWGLFNLAVAYLLICRVGDFNLRKTQHMLVLGAGILIMSLMLAHTFGRLHGGLDSSLQVLRCTRTNNRGRASSNSQTASPIRPFPLVVIGITDLC